MTRMKKILTPVVVLLICAALVYFIVDNPPETQRRPASTGPQITVNTLTIEPIDYQVMLTSFGTVLPRTQSTLVAQVSGQIMKVSDQFRDGSFFEKGDPLVWLDERDYLAEVKIAQANVLSGEQALLEEKARGEQALLDWQRLGDGSKPNALVLRTPQLEAAKAVLLSAQAQLQKAELALERTTIRAPYAGRILNTDADVGQVVNNNSQLASIYAIDVVEVRLPINNGDLALIDLPKEYRGNKVIDANTQVFLTSDLIGKQNKQAKIVRTEGAINSDSQQLYVVAQIEDPYGDADTSNMPLKIGQYVSADIVGKTLTNAIVIPNSAIYQGTYVYTVVDNALLRKDVSIAWQNASQSIINGGLEPGESLVLTTLGQVSSGTRVQVQNTQASEASNELEKPSDRRPNRPSQEELEAIAKEKGISVEQVIEQRKAARKARREAQ
ncbi:efflux RND transporter periplasmic adaptor subunit [Glaciecola sp. MH2013]|uniref:efflux RND transporter periplasmic adaptor subunit n=1 Tax=Glaciecola sp. MH2013 TaxID=2785524 RepID=UPI001E2B51B0|nr:efflux RND transporter periplasmic adaptor subunit [Glaciecola sp. MH2013]